MTETIPQDPSLMVHSYVPAVEVYPQNCYWSEVEASLSSKSQTTFYTEHPSDGALLKSNAYIKYSLQFKNEQSTDRTSALGASWEGYYGSSYLQPQGRTGAFRIAFRAGNVMVNCMDSISLNINGLVHSERPNIYHYAYMRLFATQRELDTVSSLSGGGEMDEGDFSFYGKRDNLCIMANTAPKSDAALTTRFAHVLVPPDGSMYAAFSGAAPAYPTFDISSAGANPAAAAPVQTWPIAGGPAQSNFTTTGVTDMDTAAGHLGINQSTWTQHAGKEFMNRGFEKRSYRMAKLANNYIISTGGAPSVTAAVAVSKFGPTAVLNQETFQNFEIWEPIPIQPFMTWESIDTYRNIPNVMKMTLTLSWNGNYKNLIFRSGSTRGSDHDVLQNNSLTYDVDFWNAIGKPKLQLQWVIPPVFHRPEPIISIRVARREVFQTQITRQAYGGAVTTISYNNIRLEQFPDFFLIFIRPEPGSWQCHWPDECCLSIDSIEFDIDGNTGQANNIKAQQLYQLFLRNGYHGSEQKLTFEEWYRYCCYVIIRPQDIGTPYCSGVNWAFTMNMRIKVQNNLYRGGFKHNTYAAGNKYIEYLYNNGYDQYCYLIAHYGRNIHQYRADGSAKAMMQNFSRAEVDAALAKRGMAVSAPGNRAGATNATVGSRVGGLL